MTPPSDKENALCSLFESFCVTTIRNFSRNLKRATKNRQKYEGSCDEPVEYIADLLSTEDVYASEQFALDVDGLACTLESELLYKAMLSLSDRERQVILYDFWCDLKDREIAKKLEVTERTVYNCRQRAFQKICTYYELHGQGRDP